MRNRRVARGPYWLKAKFAGKCGKCARPIERGKDAFYYPNTKTILCDSDSCGKQASRDFEAARADEAMYNGGYR